MAGTIVGIHVQDGMLVEYIDGWRKEEKKIMRATYTQTLLTIKKATKAKVRMIKTKSGLPVNTKRIIKGVRQSTWKNSKGATVYIRSPYDEYYQLLFFEGGTKERTTKKGYTGSIKANWFFRDTLRENVGNIAKGFELEFTKQLEKVELSARAKAIQRNYAARYAAAKGRL